MIASVKIAARTGMTLSAADELSVTSDVFFTGIENPRDSRVSARSSVPSSELMISGPSDGMNAFARVSTLPSVSIPRERCASIMTFERFDSCGII